MWCLLGEHRPEETLHSPDIGPVVLWVVLVRMPVAPGLWASSHCCPRSAHTAHTSCRRPVPAGHKHTHTHTHLEKEVKTSLCSVSTQTRANTHATSVSFHKVFASMQWSCVIYENDQTLSTPVITWEWVISHWNSLSCLASLCYSPGFWTPSVTIWYAAYVPGGGTNKDLVV